MREFCACGRGGYACVHLGDAPSDSMWGPQDARIAVLNARSDAKLLAIAAVAATENAPGSAAAEAATARVALASAQVLAAERAAAAANALLENREAHLRARERTRAAVLAASAAATASERRTLLAARKLASLADAQTPLPGDSRLNDEGLAVDWTARAGDGRRDALARAEDELAAIEVGVLGGRGCVRVSHACCV